MALPAATCEKRHAALAERAREREGGWGQARGWERGWGCRGGEASEPGASVTAAAPPPRLLRPRPGPAAPGGREEPRGRRPRAGAALGPPRPPRAAEAAGAPPGPGTERGCGGRAGGALCPSPRVPSFRFCRPRGQLRGSCPACCVLPCSGAGGGGKRLLRERWGGSSRWEGIASRNRIYTLSFPLQRKRGVNPWDTARYSGTSRVAAAVRARNREAARRPRRSCPPRPALPVPAAEI